jgi:hypothetical protein
MLPELLTPERAAAYQAQVAADAARKLAGRRSLYLALVAAGAYLFFTAGTLAERYHLLPASKPSLSATR